MEGESFLIAAGFLAKRGYLNLYLVMFVALIGTYIADVTIYFLGRHKGEGIISKIPVAKTYYPRVKSLFDRYGVWALFVTRYLYGFRLATAASMGLMKMRRRKYLPFDFLSCMIWATLVGGLGYIFGASLEALIGQVKHYEKVIVLFIITIGLSIWLLRRAWSKRHWKKSIRGKSKVKVEELKL